METLGAGAKSRGAREILGGPGPKQGGAGAPPAPPAAPPLINAHFEGCILFRQQFLALLGQLTILQ